MAAAPTDRPWKLAFAGGPAARDAALEHRDEGPVAARFLAVGPGAPEPVAPDGFGPDVVVVFDPSGGPPAALAVSPAVTVAYVTGAAATVDPSGYDRVLVADRRQASALPTGAVVWRAVPLPVADRHFGAVATADPAAAPLVLGRSSRRRRHVVRGLAPAQASTEPWIAINLHDGGDGGFEQRVAVQLAAGRLVLSEPLDPRHGLEPGIDYAEFRGARHLERLVAEARADPRPWRWMQVRGRAKAEHFRASRVWPRLVADVLADVAAFGPARRG